MSSKAAAHIYISIWMATPRGGTKAIRKRVIKMGAMPKIYMAYGSNLNMRQMSNRCPFAEVYGSVLLLDYRLLFRGGNGSAVATIEPCKGSSVPVGLWRITPQDEQALDKYEGWPRLYRKEIFKIRVNGRMRRVFAYIMNDGWPLGAPSRFYLSTIAIGYRDFGLDLNALRKALRDSV
jgi:hypothetical protein